MAVTIKEIAEYSGLSVPTVSHILGTRAQAYRPATRKRVIDAAQALGYRPNGSAKAVRSGRFNNVGLLLSTQPHRSSVFRGLLDGIQDALAANDLHLSLAKLPDEQLTSEGFVPKILREWSCDGLLINYFAGIPERMIELIRTYGIPSIWINSKQAADCAYPDDFEAGLRATRRLLSLGHRRISWANYSRSEDAPDHYSTRDRYEGYAQAMRQAGLTPQRIQPLLPKEAHSDYSRGWLDRPDRPTAVVTYSPETAGPILFAAIAHLHMQLPRDLSLITFEEVLWTDLGLPLDTLLVPEYALGQTATGMLTDKIESPDRPLSPRAVRFEFAAGRSCVSPTM